MRVAVFGGTGFVGGYLVDALLAAGHGPSLLVRGGSRHKLRRAAECHITTGDIASTGAIEQALDGCDAAIYNIGLLKEYPRKGVTFEEAHVAGVQRVVAAAESLGVRRFLLMSANEVARRSTPYRETKARGEDIVRDSALIWTIFQPSLIFGDSSGMQEITLQLHEQVVRPPLPAPAFRSGWSARGNTVVMSPVSVIDVADAFVNALSNTDTVGKTIVLGGPETLSWEQIIERIAEAVGRRKILVPLHIGIMMFAARLFDWLPFFPATRDQLAMLADGNTAGPVELQSLIGREPIRFHSDNMKYLR